jgi:hypothetical protein
MRIALFIFMKTVNQHHNDNKIQGDLPEIKQFIEELEHFTR